MVPITKIKSVFKPNRGIFITIEGLDGSGKTTHTSLLVNYLHTLNIPVVHTREPGGVTVAEWVRKLLLKPKTKILPITELMLYAASRAQHTEELIRPALQQGNIVVCERYTDATVAYQSYGRGLPIQLIHRINQISTNGLKPNLTLLLDVPVRRGLRKVQNRYSNKVKSSPILTDRLEQEGIEFHQRVRDGYLQIAKSNPRRVRLIQVNAIRSTQKRINQTVREFLSTYPDINKYFVK